MNAHLAHLERAANEHHLAFESDWLEPIGRILALLQRFGVRTNLVGDIGPAAVVQEHLVEALVAIEVANRTLEAPPATVVDVGAGAGLEGLLMALAWPRAALIAVEPRRKRADFIELAADAAGVGERVEVIRLELRAAHLPPASLMTSRATFSVPRWLKLAHPRLAAGGIAVAHESGNGAETSGSASLHLCQRLHVPNGSGHTVSSWRLAPEAGLKQ